MIKKETTKDEKKKMPNTKTKNGKRHKDEKEKNKGTENKD